MKREYQSTSGLIVDQTMHFLSLQPPLLSRLLLCHFSPLSVAFFLLSSLFQMSHTRCRRSNKQARVIRPSELQVRQAHKCTQPLLYPSVSSSLSLFHSWRQYSSEAFNFWSILISFPDATSHAIVRFGASAPLDGGMQLSSCVAVYRRRYIHLRSLSFLFSLACSLAQPAHSYSLSTPLFALLVPGFTPTRLRRATCDRSESTASPVHH